MASYEGGPLVMEMEGEEGFEEEAGSSGCGCGCFGLKKWWQGHEEEGKGLLVDQKGEGESWVVEKLRKAKEVSEVIAGPKWKTFIRKISGYGKKVKQQRNRFQYDEHSYALNFNSGAQSEDEGMPHSFSSRFAAPGRRQNES
ncbi:hypothetical protein AAZX31_13G142100 [Glycine max]|uniref:Stress induced protein n=2 Tax=Glycine subgen. Soja TaxID=1462606 RepID=I1LZN6_SOYBN|nr:uncharacterized protein LOC100804202 [Glycine max]XP_028188018.1 uncharacterized protein LOC114374556 [Glycine soja]KAG4970725.1 hypothetical protein JHK85_037146 [Glycine max]KAG4977129.1 hypothetical protein JHK86_036603 [Glycine max]KAG5130429.1 hypothetical protein JHK84_036826 [Glycine max]KAH1101756.1 hypothetical protein GYH30_036364 [Glycine max]KAH1217040.1 hypothetical protein GmHk_13G037777 [Glycine max]|eukprot:XP_003542626.1 uncharacterized protein LOC100804202 [Glycine max]